MTGFILEDPFPLSKFQNNIGSKNIKQNFIVGLNTLPSTELIYQELETTPHADQVVVTVQGEGIKLDHTSVQKCLQSWTTPPGIQFAQPAIYHPSNGGDGDIDYTYVLVDSGSDIIENEERKTLWIWKSVQKNEENNPVGNCISKTFQERIQGVHTSTSLRSNVILVYENGSIDLVSNDLDRLTANYKSKSDELVLWSSVFLTTSAHTSPCCIPNSVVPANSTMVITLCQAKNSKKKYTVKLNCINEERRSINETVKIDLELQNEPVAYTFDPTLGIITILETNGTWSIYHLIIKRRTVNKIVSYLDKHHQKQLNGYYIYDKEIGKVASLASLPDHFVAMVTPRALQKGSKIIEHVLSVWDVKYGTLQAEKVIKVGEKQFSAGECTCKVNVLNNSHIAVTISSIQRGHTGNNKSSKKSITSKSVVTLLPYYNQPMSLMSAMNKMKSTATFLGIDPYSLTSQDNIGTIRSGQAAMGHVAKFDGNDDQTFKNWITNLENNQQTEDALIRSFTKKDLTLDELESLFMQHMSIKEESWNKDPNITTITDLGKKLDKEKYSYKEFHEVFAYAESGKKTQLSSQLLNCILNQIFSNKNGKPDMSLWSVRILLYLIAKKQLLNTYIKGGLMRGLLDRQAWSLMALALKTVPDIPETDLILVIKELVHLKQTEPSIWATRIDYYLKAIIGANRNEIFIQQALKRLTIQELPIVLESIISWLDTTNVEGKTIVINNEGGFKALTRINNIIDFANSLLDIHFPTIILEPSLHSLMDAFHQVSIAITENASQVEEIHNIALLFEKSKKLNRKSQKSREKETKKDAPVDKSLAGTTGNKYGGDEGVPIYRVEMFQF
ncbi:unnamed protein product [Cunninghamella echinulata]